VCVSVCLPSRDCTPQCRISLGGEGNALYPVLCSYSLLQVVNTTSLVFCDRGGAKSQLRGLNNAPSASTTNIQPTPHTAKTYFLYAFLFIISDCACSSCICMGPFKYYNNARGVGRWVSFLLYCVICIRAYRSKRIALYDVNGPLVCMF